MDEIIGFLLLFLLILSIPGVVLIFLINQTKHRILSEIEKLSTKVDQVKTGLENLKKEPLIVATEEKADIELEKAEEKEVVKEETVEVSLQQQNHWVSQSVEAVEEIKQEVELQKAAIPMATKKKSTKKEKSTAKKDYENLFGVNLLSKIGIATLVLGIAYFVKYAIDQNWINEIGRVAVGVLSGAVLIGVAHRLRHNFRTFSSILIGGGISVLYITIALAFWEYRLFSQPVAFVFLILITLLSVFLSLMYDKKELAVFSLLGGFASPLMLSSGTGNYIVLFSYLLILNTGMLIIALRKQWKIVSSIAYLLTQGFYWVWLLRSFEDQYLGAIVFGLLFFVQFYSLALITYFKSQRKIAPFQTFVILGNNLSLFCSAFYIFDEYTVDLRGLITISIAVLNALPLWIVYKDKNVNTNMLYMLIALVLSFVSLAVPVQLDGSVITMFWAAETIILLFLYRSSSMSIFKKAYCLLQVLVIIALVMDWSAQYYVGGHSEGLRLILNEAFITGVVVVVSLFVNLWLNKTINMEFKSANGQIRLRTLLKLCATFLIFLCLLQELSYQVAYYSPGVWFTGLVQSIYIYLFIAAYAVLKWKKVKWMRPLYLLILLATLSYATYYVLCLQNLVDEILWNSEAGWGKFALHYLSIPALLVFFFFLIKKANIFKRNSLHVNHIYWIISIVSVIVLSVETDSLALMLFGDHLPENQSLVLQYSRTIAYPILWGIISFILMVLGMKSGNRNLRLISLSLLGLIIAKLYLHDIWGMNQTGRIIAFIFLGLLFLLVSFLYQKLKILFQEKEEDQTNE